MTNRWLKHGKKSRKGAAKQLPSDAPDLFDLADSDEIHAFVADGTLPDPSA